MKAAPINGFLDCQLKYYWKFKEQEKKYNQAKADLRNSSCGLIVHPKTSERFKSQLRKLINEL